MNLAQKQGESFERGIQLATQAILTSPHFLFRVETNPKDAKADPKYGGEKIGLLDDYQLASRLSYFLWSSLPDEELFDCAARGALKDPAVLEKQTRRMLKDQKAQALADNFASQWLTLRNLDTFTPDPDYFPDFNENLRTAMRQETSLFFQAIVREDRSIMDFLDADFTYLNEPLARHYGIKGVSGTDLSARGFRCPASQTAWRIALTSQRANGDFQPNAHFASEARQMGAGNDFRHAAAAAAAQRARISRSEERRGHFHDCAPAIARTS